MGREKSARCSPLSPRNPWSAALIVACLSGSAIADGVDFLLAPRFAVAIDGGADDAQAALISGLEMPFAWSRLGAYGEFEFRVFGKDRIVPVTPTLRMQYQELRYTVGTGFYAALPLSGNPIGEYGRHSEARLGGGIGYSVGEYRGTEVSPEWLWVPWIDAGYGLRFGGRGSLILGYQYRPLPHVSPHRAGLSCGLVIPGVSKRKGRR